MTREVAGSRWRVFRDPAGVPHVQGADLVALATGHGAVTARDRAWHLEVLRRRAEGRSAELLGPDHRDADQLTLALEVELTALRWWKAAAPEDQQFLAAYASGVNGEVQRAWSRSPEARELGLDALQLRPWQPWTSLAVHLDAHLLSGSLPENVWRHRVRTALGEAWVSVLDAETPRGSGSNAWLVPGRLSVSGAPLIAADPHRVVEESGPYQPVCFSAPGLRVRGLALVGLPGVPHFGRTESAAWAITAAMTTTEHVTEVAVQRRRGVLVIPETGEELEERAVHLDAMGAGAETRWLRKCSRGFVLPGDRASEARLLDLAEGERARVLAVRPSQPCAPERAVSACRELLTATTVADVAEAWNGWAVPVNDVVAADRTGACVHTVAGSYVAAPASKPAPCAVDRTVEHLHGLTVRANQRPEDRAESAARLGCAPPHRARRAARLFEQAVIDRGAVSHEDLLAAQLDTRLCAWPDLVHRLLGPDVDSAPVAGGGTDGDTPPDTEHDPRPGDLHPGSPTGTPATELPSEAIALRDRLLAWDGSMAADSEDAALFAEWRDAFARQLAASDALQPLRGTTGLPPLWRPFVDPVARVGLALESIVTHGHAVGLSARDAAVAAVESMVADRSPVDRPQVPRPAAAHGTGRRGPAGPGSRDQLAPWGRLHAFTPHRAHPDLSPYRSVAVGGDTDCLLSTGTIPGWDPGCVRVPAARVLWDLADPAASWWITPDPVDRGTLGSSPMERWARGETDQALPWVPAGGLEPTDRVLPLGRLSDGLAAVGRPFVPVVGSVARVADIVSGHLSLRPVNAERDAELIHSWVREKRARFWGMTDLTLQQVRELYGFLASTPTHHAWLIELNGTALGLFQTYEPHADVTGACYTVQPGDLGIHVLLAPTQHGVPGMTDAIGALIQGEIMRQGRTRRIVAEPDVSNHLALARLEATGFTPGPVIDLPHKSGRLAFLSLR